MIVLDTNVISETMKPSPETSVIDWLDRRETSTLYLTTVTVAEIGFGLQVLPNGRRRRALEDRFERFVTAGFAHRVLAFDLAAARVFGGVVGRRRELGRPMGIADGQIASIARSRRFAIATRNVRDFEDCGLDVLNPFASS